MDFSGGLLELFGQVGPLDRIDRHILPAILGAFGRKFAQHHVGVVHKILVDRETLRCPAHLYPLRFPVDGAFQFLQKEDVGNYFRTCVGLEGIVGQPHCAQ